MQSGGVACRGFDPQAALGRAADVRAVGLRDRREGDTEETASMLSRLSRRMFRQLGSPELRPVDAALAFLLISSVIAAGFSLQLHNALQRTTFPYADRQWIAFLLAFQMRFVFPSAVGLAVSCLFIRSRWPQSSVMAHIVMQWAMLCALCGSFVTGLYTFDFGIGAFFGLGTVALFLFEVHVVRLGLVTFTAGVVAITALEQMSVIPYGPMFPHSPIEDGQLARRFLFASLSSMVLVVITLFIFVASIERLRRATNLIRRYLPAQLATKILTGEHGVRVTPERRKVTLFFSDVVSFTEAADRMEAEDLSALLNEYLSEMATIADLFGATLNQFVGDGIMIFFGAPVVTRNEDQALRAVRMAKAMQRRMGELREKWFHGGIQTPFQIRIGINTGVASVGDFGSAGRMTYSAIGNQTNLTARIQAACEPGKILISHTTWALVKDQIPCKERGEIHVKGLHYPVRVYEVLWEESPESSES
jgi:adenylate cyclase